MEMKEFLPYSKEIMKHFKNPKNLGRMKNADAVGEAGNIQCGDIMRIYLKIKEKNGKKMISDIKGEVFGCLPGDQEVVVQMGDWRPISSISEGEIILNKIGEKGVVSRKSIRYYEGTILTIIPSVSPFNSFSITPEHPVLCIKRKWLKSARKANRQSNWPRINKNELLHTKPRYIRAEKLEPSDYLIFVANNRVKDDPIFTFEMMRLIGFYLAEGYIISKGYGVAFSFNKNEKKTIAEVKSLVQKIVRKKAKERTRKNVKEIYICSRNFANFLISVCGKGAKYKRLSEKILYLPTNKQWEMVKAYLIGDGSSRRRWPKESLTYTIGTASKTLAIQMQEILARRGIFASIKKYSTKEHTIEGRKIKSSTLFEITFKLKRKKHRFFYVKEKKYYLIPIKKIEKKPYKGYVYNLELLSEPHSYLVKGFCVHNCIVAIANTSILTTMVKGKTLEEALKIHKEELIKKLGGREKIPPFKIHCSILAADALHEAIYNYYKKQNLPIPEELRKEHERIQKTLKDIEKRHVDFIKMEREILK
jgi:NifU-like protein involved in Fe-S cluster formation